MAFLILYGVYGLSSALRPDKSNATHPVALGEDLDIEVYI